MLPVVCFSLLLAASAPTPARVAWTNHCAQAVEISLKAGAAKYGYLDISDANSEKAGVVLVADSVDKPALKSTISIPAGDSWTLDIWPDP
jgi:hypothetical protein